MKKKQTKSPLRKKREAAAKATRSAMKSVSKPTAFPSVAQQEKQLAKLSDSKLAEMMQGFDGGSSPPPSEPEESDEGESLTIAADELVNRRKTRNRPGELPAGLSFGEVNTKPDEGSESMVEIARSIDDKLDEILNIMRG